ncbi:STAS/SEC14 domain-containing protein [Maribacter algarum]|uniref:STAS/SEC14 domain-containing protein n=1 Tax=Maribacter algarum (ex Zhang et al. 2020) TaxID=2578118 RepID=A0A5S3PUM7_9FLAO|nr:STAS/SEC14 domain-containing protein [Maribacter algarum]TMM58716.1 STAS/SEC14 domain-containing protein [Maribacter algarum]
MGTTTKINRKVLSTLETKIGKFEYYSNMVVGEVKEGVHVTFETAVEPLQEGAQIFGYAENFVYISHRLHSYSIDPTGYYEAASMFPNFKALAIVATNRRRRMLANLERLFMKRPIHVFDNLESAFEWAETFLENQPKNPF